MFCSAGLGLGSAVVYPIHSGTGGPCCKVRRQTKLVHAFADDNQLHVHFDLSNVLSSVNALEQCMSAISQWMSANQLKLCADKTELMWASTKYTVASLLRN